MCQAEIEVSIGVLVATRLLDLWTPWLVAVVVVVFVLPPVVNVNDRACTAGVLLWGDDTSLGSLGLLIMRLLTRLSSDPNTAHTECRRWSQHDPCTPHQCPSRSLLLSDNSRGQSGDAAPRQDWRAVCVQTDLCSA